MLVKCACSNCGHSFLTDDQAGDLTCPRCGFVTEGGPQAAAFAAEPPDRTQPTMAAAPPPDPFGGPPQIPHGLGEDMGFAAPPGFDPKTPPPVFMTWDRMLRGIVIGGIMTASIGAAIGGGFAAIGLVIPGVAALVMALMAGSAVRYGMGGRAASRTRGFAMTAVVLAVLMGYTGILTGSWLVERFTGERASITRNDLKVGSEDLTLQLGRAQKIGDVTKTTTLQTRLKRVERLEDSTDAQLEDYLWVQQAQISQPFVAYAKLRVTDGPVLKLGLDNDAIEMPKHSAAGVVGLELLLGIFLAWRGVRSKR